MAAETNEQRIRTIDKEVAKLLQERLELGAGGAQDSQSALSSRSYERSFMNELEREYPGSRGYEQILFQTIFNLSHSYRATSGRSESDLAGKINTAIETTPKLFPSSAMVACQGIEGAYSQIATDKIFSHANIMYFRTFEGVFQAVENGLCEFGILPIENSSYGSVTQVYDLMADHKFHIVRGQARHEARRYQRGVLPQSGYRPVQHVPQGAFRHQGKYCGEHRRRGTHGRGFRQE